MKMFMKTLCILLFLICFHPLKFDATVNEGNRIKAELNLLGEKNFIVYTIPNEQIKSENLSGEILHTLETHYEIQNHRIEKFSNETSYTYFFNQFIDGDPKKSYQLNLHYDTLLGTFDPNYLIDFTIIGSKLLDIDFINSEINFNYQNTYSSDQQWLYTGLIADIVNMNQIVEVSIQHEQFKTAIVMYFGMIIVSICLCFILANYFKNNAISSNIQPSNVRKFGYKYQYVPLFFYVIAIVYCVYSGLINALLSYYGNAIGVLFIFLPIVLFLTILISSFIPAEKEVIRVLENKEKPNRKKAIYFSFIPILIAISLTICNVMILEFIPWNKMQFISDNMMFYIKNTLRILVLTIAFLVSPILYNILLPKKELQQGALKQKIIDLSAQFDVQFEKIYIVSSKDTYTANAMVSSGINNYLYLYDYLIDHLSEKELYAVLLHEIAHIHKKHTARLFFASIGLFVLSQLCLYFFPQFSTGLLFLYFGALFTLIPSFMRKFEYEADAFVLENGGTSDALKSTLLKLSELNYIPLQTKGARKWFDTHPSVYKRIKKMK